MKHLSVSQAREQLPQLLDKVYFNSQRFVITKRGIPMAEIKTLTTTIPQKTTPKAKTQASNNFFGLWKNRWQSKTTGEVVEIIREKAWNSHAA